ncbi:hypothetical protein DPMN_192036 [Dreissena polymorpha]|uniref:Uncharacterized protein n=1 Tax=Dreissena polymorpha TaxID=45954 RepID=A0A9D4BDL9_DREPO|nr:hypothetical protein DPMN_192036 [Dreissena polymorpha]
MLRRHAYHVIPRLPCTIGNGIAELTNVRCALWKVLSPFVYGVTSFSKSFMRNHIKNSDNR